MQKRLPKAVFKSVLATIEHSEPLDPTVADIVASAMKDWAIEKGASHYVKPSSLPNSAKTTGRRGRGPAASTRASSSTATTPDASSSAPL